jgi:predicted DNA-binding antitoxin AbrB/MazE fold protein
MLKTIEAILEKNGRLRLLEKLNLTHAQRVLVTFLEEKTESESTFETALLSEAALAEDWNRPQEDEAWEHLQ